MIQLMRENNIPLINVVRREEQVEFLKNECKAEYVLNSSDPKFDDDLYELSKKLDANVAMECVAGEMCGRVQQVLAPLSENAVFSLYTSRGEGGRRGGIRHRSATAAESMLFGRLNGVLVEVC